MNYSHPAGKKSGLLLVILFCLVQAGLLMAYGIYTQEEAAKYIYEAGFFREHGVFSQPKYVFYSGYIFLRVLADALHTGDIGVYIFQVILNALATICFYRLALRVSSSGMAAVISTALLILCIPFQKWTAYLFTESVFFSLLIIYTYVLFTQFKNAYARPALLLLLLLLLIISRPTGMLVIPASLLLASHYLFANGKKLLVLVVWVPGLAGLALLLDTAIKGKGEFDFIKPFIEEHIICGLPSQQVSGESWHFPKGGGQSEDGNSLLGLIRYIAHNLGEILRLALLRLGAFFGLVRSYYSGLHNILLMAGFYPVYILAATGFRWVATRAKPFFVFSLTLIATFTLSVMLTCDDWHNRFIMPIMPLIFIYAGIGAVRLCNRLFKKKEPIAPV